MDKSYVEREFVTSIILSNSIVMCYETSLFCKKGSITEKFYDEIMVSWVI
jgi:hypothetical protein